MRRKTLLTITAIGFSAAFLNTVASSAQEVRKGQGFVFKKENNHLVMKEYDETKKASLENTYWINGTTSFRNFPSIDDILEYDVLEIEYTEIDGKRTALSILKRFPAQRLFDQMEYDSNKMQDIQEISDEYRG